MQTESASCLCSNTEIHKRCVPMASAKHIERHMQEVLHHVEAGIAEHALERQLLALCELERGML